MRVLASVGLLLACLVCRGVHADGLEVRMDAPDQRGVAGSHSGALDIHSGDGELTSTRCPDGTHQLLIDAGDNCYPGSAQAFRAFIESHQAQSELIEVVVATHPHADHIGSMDWVVNNYSIGLYLDSGMPGTTATWRRADEALSQQAVPHWEATDTVPPDIDFCPRPEVSARVLRPAGYGHDSDPNNNSVIVRVDMGNDSFLFVGDAEAEEEALLLADPTTRPLLDTTFLKVGHHGSHTSTRADFLAAVSPTVARISCGAPGVSTKSSYMHPRAESIERLLGVCGPRQGLPFALDAFDTAQDAWSTLTLNRAVYVTTVEGDLLFWSWGTGVQRITIPLKLLSHAGNSAAFGCESTVRLGCVDTQPPNEGKCFR